MRPSQPKTLTEDERIVQRQAFAGMLWSKQFYHFNVARWLKGDPGSPPPPAEAKSWSQQRLDAPRRATSSPCPTNGSIPGSRPGTWLSIAFRWLWSTPISPRTS